MGEPLPLDARWIGLCRAGDMAAWRALYHQHLPMVYRVARRMGVPESDFGDLCQEVFLRVYRGLGRFRGEAEFTTWLYRIVLREVARAGRARAVRQAFLKLLHLEPLPGPGEGPHGKLEAALGLEDLLGRMKPKQREVFVLFELEELPLEEIARLLHCPLETVRSRLRHARTTLARWRQARLSSEGDPR